MNNFRTHMANQLSSSRCEDPARPIRPGSPETIIVELNEDRLSISDTHLFDFPDSKHGLFAANNRIQARKVKQVGDDTVFDMLEKIAQPDAKPFLVLAGRPHDCRLSIGPDGILRLRAYGTDDGNGRSNCGGWIFDAIQSSSV
ncbi:hypothetical protein NKJ40_00850 [Mesorhizobium sp. M0119]|uniref:hypothetical protein n=1 Tax=unclassified Mesorhizobium TaxID=325217 RepID=UPI003336AAEC